MKRTLALLAAAGVSGAAAWRLLRLKPLAALPAPRLAVDYAAALARVAGLRAAEGERVNPACRTRLLTHGRRMPRAIALLHGFTNCPAQFDLLAQQFFDLGWNVLIPRLAQHGLRERAPRDFGRLTAEEMVRQVAEVSDTLHGLGEETTLFGFSMGGAQATWAAQFRSDLDHVVIASPAIAVQNVGPMQRRLYPNLLPLLRDKFVYWDPMHKETIPGPAHAYPGYSSHAIAQLMRMGALAETAARRQIYAAARVTVITNPSDDVVENHAIARVVARWRQMGAPVTMHEFPRAWGLIHDLVDPAQPAQQVERVYPLLVEWVAGTA